MSTISNLIFKGAKHYVKSSFGKRDPIKTSAGTTSSFHNGTDYGTDSIKIPQYAIEDGYVFAAAKSNSDGANYVWVIYPRVKLAMIHYHLDSYKVKSGQSVTKGTLLGYTGMTGMATGIHLHLGIRNLSKLTDSQVKKMTWDNLRKCDYIDPEKVVYSEAKVEAPKPVEKKVLPGATLNLKNKELYASSSTNKVAKKITGTFYAYDGNVVNGRVRITISRAFVGKVPVSKHVTGWINV